MFTLIDNDLDMRIRRDFVVPNKIILMQSVQDYVLYGRCHVPVIPIIFLVCMQNKKKINLHTNLTSTRNSGLGKFIGE
jgi:hypothetical protein